MMFCKYMFGLLAGSYYVVNIIPRLTSYLYYLHSNRNALLKYLFSGKLIEITTTDYLIKLYTNMKNLWYHIELVPIYPYDCSGCGEYRLANKYIFRTIVMIKQLLFIKIKENNILTRQLKNCYTKYFNIKLGVVMYNIIKNIIRVYNELREQNFIKSKLSAFRLFDRIIKIEKDYNKYINKENSINIETVHTYFQYILTDQDTILSQNDNSSICVFNDTDNFITVPSLKMDKYNKNFKEQMFKLLVWFVTPKLDNFDQISNSLDSIVKFLYSNNKSDSIRNCDIKKEDFINIYSCKYNREEAIDIIENHMLYTVNDLIDYSKYKPEYNNNYNQLIRHINHTVKKYGMDDYYYSYYHYLTVYQLATLHIHITKKQSKIFSLMGTITNMVTVGQRGNFSHSQNKYINHDFSKFDKNIWYYNHTIVISILCLKDFLKYLKSHGGHKNSQLLRICNNIIEGKEVDTTIDELIKFIFECMENTLVGRLAKPRNLECGAGHVRGMRPVAGTDRCSTNGHSLARRNSHTNPAPRSGPLAASVARNRFVTCSPSRHSRPRGTVPKLGQHLFDPTAAAQQGLDVAAPHAVECQTTSPRRNRWWK